MPPSLFGPSPPLAIPPPAGLNPSAASVFSLNRSECMCVCVHLCRIELFNDHVCEVATGDTCLGLLFSAHPEIYIWFARCA